MICLQQVTLSSINGGGGVLILLSIFWEKDDNKCVLFLLAVK